MFSFNEIYGSNYFFYKLKYIIDQDFKKALVGLKTNSINLNYFFHKEVDIKEVFIFFYQIKNSNKNFL